MTQMAVVTETPWLAQSGAALRDAVRRQFTTGRLLLVLAVVLLVVSLPLIPEAESTTFGLLFAGVPGIAAAVICSVVSLLIAVRTGRVAEAIAAVAVFVACSRLPVALGAPLPIYSWTYKHIGVVDYIVEHGTVSHGVDIYSGWPGAFAAVAWVSEVSGVGSIALAQWFSVAVHVALVLAMYALARAFRLSRMTSVVVAFIAEVVNWVGQDYFSPQSIAFVLAVVIVVLLLKSSENPVYAWLSLPIFAALTMTHQLTPYWLVGVAIVLGITGRIRPRFIGVVFGAVAGCYLLLHLDAVGGHSLFSGFDLFANAGTNTGSATSAGQKFTGNAAKIAAVGLWALAAVAAVIAVKRVGWRASGVVTASVIAFSPFALLAVQNYGGEAIYRVFLYSIPGCALLCAPLVVRMLRSSRSGRRQRVSLVLGVSMAILVSLTSLQAYYGGWFSNLVNPTALRVGTEVLENAPADALVLSAAPGAPSRMTARYTEFAAQDPLYDLSLSSWEGWHGQSFEDPAVSATMTAELLATGRPVYLMVSQQMKDDSDYYGLYPPGSIDRFADQLEVNPAWSLVTDSNGVQLFALRGTDA